MVLISFSLPTSALGVMDFVEDVDGQEISIPQTHRILRFLRDAGAEGGAFSSPSDLFIDTNDNVYVADTTTTA